MISCSVSVIIELLKNTPEEWEHDSVADGKREVGLLVANINTLSGDSKHASSAKVNRFLSLCLPSVAPSDLLSDKIHQIWGGGASKRF